MFCSSPSHIVPTALARRLRAPAVALAVAHGSLPVLHAVHAQSHQPQPACGEAEFVSDGSSSWCDDQVVWAGAFRRASVVDVSNHPSVSGVFRHATITDITTHPPLTDITTHTPLTDITTHPPLTDITSHTPIRSGGAEGGRTLPGERESNELLLPVSLLLLPPLRRLSLASSHIGPRPHARAIHPPLLRHGDARLRRGPLDGACCPL